jgi:hypothetical protein
MWFIGSLVHLFIGKRDGLPISAWTTNELMNQ